MLHLIEQQHELRPMHAAEQNIVGPTCSLLIDVMAILEHEEDLLGSVGRDEHIKDGSKASGVVLQALGVPAIRAPCCRHLS